MISILLLVLLVAQSPGASHVDHQPTQAGIFATAADDTLHLEAFLPAGMLRVIVSDRAGHVLSPDRLRALNVRIADSGREQAMRLSADERSLEAPIPIETKLPLTITIALTSAPSSEQSVPFTFSSHNVSDAEKILVPPTAIPPTLGGILEMLRTESVETQAMLDSKPNHGVLVAVTRVRDLALALEPYVATLPSGHARAQSAIREAVRTSWLAHAAADDGLPHQTYLGVMLMRDALRELRAAFGDVD